MKSYWQPREFKSCRTAAEGHPQGHEELQNNFWRGTRECKGGTLQKPTAQYPKKLAYRWKDKVQQEIATLEIPGIVQPSKALGHLP